MMNFSGGYNTYQYNPYMTAQQRLYQMEQQYPQLAQQTGSLQTPLAQTLNTIPVTNIEEANAFRVDLNGTPTFFYNAGKNEIYLKRTNTQTGLADFQIFGKREQQQSVVKENLDVSTYSKDLKALSEKIDGLYSLLSVNQQPQPKEVENEYTGHQMPQKGGKNVK